MFVGKMDGWGVKEQEMSDWRDGWGMGSKRVEGRKTDEDGGKTR